MEIQDSLSKQAARLICTQINLHSEGCFEGLNKQMMHYFQGQQQEICIQSIQFMLFRVYQQHINKDPVVQQFLCGRQLKSGIIERNECYTCQECRKEINSIICMQCFDKSKHKDHMDKVKLRKFDPGSSCDCGDSTKWSVDGFCEKHKYRSEIKQLSEAFKINYQQKTFHFLKILYILYRLYLDISVNGDPKVEKIIKLKIETFGSKFIQQLCECNKNRYNINRLTSDILMKKIQLKNTTNQPQKTISIVDTLLSFTKLPKTAVMSRNLLILLFYRNQRLRQLVTIAYVERYSTFVQTEYRVLSCHLLSNSLMISDLVKRKELGKFILQKKLSDSETGDLEQQVSTVIGAHIDYLTDNMYLSGLKEECGSKYWNHFSDVGGFLEIGNYCESFVTQSQFEIINKKYYHIQYNCLSKVVKIFQLMFNMKDFNFFKKLISRLFEKITKPSPIGSFKNNLFLTYERIWAIAAYIFLLKQQQSRFIPNEQVSQRQQKQISKLYKALGLNNLQQTQEKFIFLFKKILNYVHFSDQIPFHKEFQLSHQKFIVNYHCNNFLFSVDAIFFQIIIKMIAYISKRISSSFETMTKIINTKINQMSRSILILIKQIIYSQYSEINKNKYIAYSKIEHLCNFSKIILQLFYSEVPDLFLATKFSSLRSRKHYQEKYIQYYYNLLASLNEPKQGLASIKKTDFQKLVRVLLFQQAQSLKKFYNETLSNNPQLLAKSSSKNRGKVIDLQSHMGSLKKRIHIKQFVDNYDIDDVHAIPFVYKIKHQPYHLIQSNLFDLMAVIFRNLLQNRFYKKHSQNLLCYNLMKQMWKISHYSESLKFKETIHKILISTKQINKLPEIMVNLHFLNQHFEEQFTNFYQDMLPAFQLEKIQEDDEYEVQKYDNFRDQYIDSLENMSESLQNHANKMNNIQQPYSLELNKNDSIIQQKCSACDKEDQNIHQLCFATFSAIPMFFGIHPNSRMLYISSCEHYFHRQCLLQQLKILPENGNYSRCPICKSRFNFLLLSEYELNLNFDQLVKGLIQDMFKKIFNILSPNTTIKNKQLNNFYLRIIKSIIIFVLMVSTKSKSEFNKMRFQTQKNLIAILKRYIRSKQKDYKQKFEDMFDLVSNQKFESLFCFLKEIFGSKIIDNSEFDPYSIKQVNISNGQAEIIDGFLDCVFSEKFFNNVRKNSNSKEQINSFVLPDKLFQLHIQEGACRCHSPTSKPFMLCLLHNQPHIRQFSCLDCRINYIKDHIQKHSNQMLVMNLHTGQITYFAKFNRQYWQLPVENVYKDSLSKSIPIQIHFNYQKKSTEYETFAFDQDKYSEILFKYYSKTYLIRGDLKPIPGF